MNGQSDQKKLSSTYVRPNQKWICGGTDSDCQCVFGPDNAGNCSRVDGEKCKPRWNLRAYRGSFTIGVSFFVVGAMLIGIWQPWRADFLAPGPLCVSHAQLLTQEANDRNRCAACHEAGSSNPVSWIVDTFSGGSHLGTPQSEKCLTCHDETFDSDLALAAHNVDAGLLKNITANQTAERSLNLRLFNSSVHNHAEIACATCHREHHGVNHDLTAITDTQCQTCHQSQIGSFANDHPDFGDWSTRVSLGIEFDHAAHLLKHFPQANSGFDCRLCHVEDARGNVVQLASFEQSCAACHEKPLDNHLSNGVPLVVLPIVDKQQLEKAGYTIGEWPEMATGGFDGKIPALMKVLLNGYPSAERALQMLGSDFEFTQLDTDDDKQMAAAVEVIWATKQLVYDLAIEGKRGLRERLEESLNRQIDQQIVDQLIKQVSQPALRDMQARWFPNLPNERSHFRDANDLNAVGYLAAPGDQIQLANMLEDSNAQELLHENPISKIYSTGLPTVIYGNAGSGSEPEQSTANSDAVTIDPTIHGSAETGRQTDVDEGQAENAKDESNDLTVRSRPIQQYPDGDRMTGWVRDDERFTLTYHPEGHADPFVKVWLDFAAQSRANDSKNQSFATLLKELNPASGTGYCLSCHQTTEHESASTVRVNWKGAYRDTSRRGFTWFSHAPHLMHTSLQNCESCHQLDQAKRQDSTPMDYLKVNEKLRGDWTPNPPAKRHHSDFLAVGKKNCSQCHKPNAAGQNCTQCHHYHVGSRFLSK